jgi:hypothetical protein
MAEYDEDTCSLTLRRVSLRTSDALYRAKMVTGKPICLLADEIVSFYFQHHPHLLETPQELLESIREDLEIFARQLRLLAEVVRPQAELP